MNFLIILITSAVAAVLSYYLNLRTNLGPVKASAFPALVVGVLFYLFPNILDEYLTLHIPLVFIGASFIGMSTRETLGKYQNALLPSLLFGLLYLATTQVFAGVGGKLGLMSGISVLVSLSVMAIPGQRK